MNKLLLFLYNSNLPSKGQNVLIKEIWSSMSWNQKLKGLRYRSSIANGSLTGSFLKHLIFQYVYQRSEPSSLPRQIRICQNGCKVIYFALLEQSIQQRAARFRSKQLVIKNNRVWKSNLFSNWRRLHNGEGKFKKCTWTNNSTLVILTLVDIINEFEKNSINGLMRTDRSSTQLGSQ